MNNNPVVGIVLGSDSDLSSMREAVDILEKFGVPWEITVASAHRSPARASKYALEARDRGIKVIIAGAGWAAHLAGVLAAETILPVIGVPLPSSPLNGLDALLSTVQMPSGVPVATMALSGARNAAILAVQILALNDEKLSSKLLAFKTELAQGVEDKAASLISKLKN
jgi:phosphoribosylaminoimidazole carboxylase PurE protein